MVKNVSRFAFWLSIGLLGWPSCIALATEEAGTLQPPYWQIREYHAPDPLGHEEVLDIAFTPDGATWFATRGKGVTKLSPYGERVIYDQDKGLTHNHVSSLRVDDHGGVWVGTSEGVNYIYQNKVVAFAPAEKKAIAVTPINDMAIDGLGRVWFGGLNGHLFYFEPAEHFPQQIRGQWKQAQCFQSGRQIRSIEKGEGDTLWIGRAGQLAKIKVTEKGNQVVWREELPWNAIEKIHDSFFWLGVDDSLFQYKNGERRRLLDLPSIVTDLEVFQDRLLIGTANQGLFAYNPANNDLQYVPLNPRLPEMYIECIQKVDDNNIWVGTRNGVYHLFRSTWQRSLPHDSATPFQGRTLTKAKNGALYAIDRDHHLYQHRNNQWLNQGKIELDESIVGHNQSHQLIHWNENTFFYILLRQIVQLTVNEDVRSQMMPLPGEDDVVSDMGESFVDREGRFWLPHQDGVYLWQDGAWQLQPQLKERKQRHVFAIDQPDPHTYWLMGRGWVEEWREGQGRLMQLPKSFTDYADEWSKIYWVEEHEGQYWFATDKQGVLVKEKDGWNHLTIQDGLPTDGTSKIYSGSDGTLWVGSRTNGLASLKNGRWIQYNYTDGIPGGRIFSIVEDEKGTIWLGVEFKGIVKYQPDDGSPIVWIENYPTRLLPNETSVFSFEGQDKWQNTPSEELVFSWRIVNNDNQEAVIDWRPYARQRSIQSPQLPPGDYRIEVLCQDQSRNTSVEPAAAVFTVDPYFWQTYQFWTPVSFAFLSTIGGFGFWLRKHLQLKNSEWKYRNLVEKDSVTLILHWNRNGQITYLNEAAQEKLGLQGGAERGLGEEISQLIARAPDGVEEFYRAQDRALQNKARTLECKLQAPNGEWITWYIRMTDDSRAAIELQGIGIIITDQVAAEASLYQERISFRQFCDSAQIGIFRIDEKQNINYMNPVMRRITGNDDQRIYHIEWEQPYEFESVVERARLNQDPVTRLLAGYHREEGSQFYILISAIRKSFGVEIMAVDYTAQKEFEKRITMASIREQQRLGYELHDGLGQQLTAMVYLSSTLATVADHDPQRAKQQARHLEDNLRSATALARKISYGLNPTPIEQGALSESISSLLQSYQAIYQTNINFLEDQPWNQINSKHADGVYRIVREAVFNSLKHAEAATINVSIASEEPCWIIRIQDDGVGLENAGNGKQTGMGLSMMRYYAAQMGAQIDLSKQPAGGTMVLLSLPK